MALFLAVRAAVKPGQAIAVEEPGYPLAWEAFRAAGAAVRPIDPLEQRREIGAHGVEKRLHFHRIDADRFRKQRGRDMIGIAERRAADGQTARVFLQRSLNILEAFDRRLAAHHHHFVFGKHLGNRRHVLVRITGAERQWLSRPTFCAKPIETLLQSIRLLQK